MVQPHGGQDSRGGMCSPKTHQFRGAPSDFLRHVSSCCNAHQGEMTSQQSAGQQMTITRHPHGRYTQVSHRDAVLGSKELLEARGGPKGLSKSTLSSIDAHQSPERQLVPCCMVRLLSRAGWASWHSEWHMEQELGRRNQCRVPRPLIAAQVERTTFWTESQC